MKLSGFLFLLFLSITVLGQQPKDNKQAAAKYIQKFLEFTSKTYEIFTDEFENYLKRPNAFFPEDEEGKLMSEIQKQASEDVERVYAKARFKFAKSAGDTSEIGDVLRTIRDKFLSHFDSSASKVRDINKEQFAIAKKLPPEQLNPIIMKNKTSFDALLKKLSDLCDKIDGQYDEYMRCNMIREALSQTGKGQVNW